MSFRYKSSSYRQAITPRDEKFWSGKFKALKGTDKGEHGPVKVIFSKDPYPVVDPPTLLGRRAGENRRNCKKYEVTFRDELARRFNQQGIYFQHSVAMADAYIVDFFCPTHNLIIELDGPIHDSKVDKDRLRDYLIWVRTKAITARYTVEMISSDLDGVMADVARALEIRKPA